MGTNIMVDEHASVNEPLILDEDEQDQVSRVWLESKKLWRIVGPTIFSRLSSFSMNLVTQAFSGHLGDLHLASFSIAIILLLGFNYGLMLGMASALETLCGQAFGAKKYSMLGMYLQRSWIVLFFFSCLLLPIYIYATPILKLLGQPEDVADMAGQVAWWLIPVHFSYAFQLPLTTFLQSQVKAYVIAYVAFAGLLLNLVASWMAAYVFDLEAVGLCVALDVSWWFLVVGLYVYVTGGWCPLTWTGFAPQHLKGLIQFLKLSAASGVMMCLENWYYRILIVMTGYLPNATIALDALSICMFINGWEIMIPLAFFAGTAVRVANELGAGNAKGAKFATQVSVIQSSIIGLIFGALMILLLLKIALIFTTSPEVLKEIDLLSSLLVATVILNSVQPVLSGVAVGSGWQAYVAYINLSCYYIVGLPLGIVMGWIFKLGVRGVWGGMIFGGTAIQTIILVIITLRCDWEREAQKAKMRLHKWSVPLESDDQP